MKTRANMNPIVTFAVVAITTVALLVPAAAADKKKADKKGGPAAVPDLVWPLPPQKPRVKYLGAVATNEDVEPPKKRGFLKKLINEEDVRNVVGLLRPTSVAVDSKDRIYVADGGAAAVFVFDIANKKLELLGVSAQGRLSNPYGIAIDKNDRIYVSDIALKCVNVYGPDFAPIGIISKVGAEALVSPTGLAIDEVNNRLLVVDSKAHRVLAVDLNKLDSGNWYIGDKDAEEYFYFPSHVAVDAAGRVYVADTMNFCVKVFDKDFKWLRQIGEHGTALGNFDRPRGVALDNEGNVYVVDAAFSNFQIFNDQGQLLLFVGAFGWEPGMFRLPTGMHIDKKNRIYVVDTINARVQMFQFLGGK